MDFTEFKKIPRWSRDIVITEKIDGTNACVFIRELSDDEVMLTDTPIIEAHGKLLIYAGKRTGWIDLSKKGGDNFDFGQWVRDNVDELVTLGPGLHFGEWWGAKIQRTYGLEDRRFSLFNVARWSGPDRPTCCHVVPVLYAGPNRAGAVDDAVGMLDMHGSSAAPGFQKPEGIVVLHTASGQLFKKTIEKDEQPKGRAA